MDDHDDVITFLVHSFVVVILYRFEPNFRWSLDDSLTHGSLSVPRLRNTWVVVGSRGELQTNDCILGISKIVSHLLFHIFVSLGDQIEKLLLIVVKPVFLTVI